MATTADFRNGLVIEFNGDLWTIVEFQHVKPGKGPAFVRTKLKNLKTGRVLPNTFTSGVKINVQRVEKRPYQFLYNEGDTYHFMNMEDYEQTFVDKNIIPRPELLKEGQEVTIAFHAETETPLYVEMPAYVTLSEYSPERVSTFILSPVLINKGTLIVAPVSTVASLYVFVAVFPFSPGSV